MNLLSPQLLSAVAQKDQSVEVAMAILKHHVEDVLLDRPFHSQKISINDIDMAHQLWTTGLIHTDFNFDDYKSVHQFIVKNDKFLDAGVKSRLLAPFE